ncbi:hypothetical protein QVD17_39916 [Tagetes erecta]|uniref:Uncharacterized protein n=1 Tax=Tagetes erecta TaxID=13708 RepID=A0AAD8JQZ0_TARER|nr:hypothetical protein QVD17_39916 [Tagetes erecta]
MLDHTSGLLLERRNEDLIAQTEYFNNSTLQMNENRIPELPSQVLNFPMNNNTYLGCTLPPLMENMVDVQKCHLNNGEGSECLIQKDEFNDWVVDQTSQQCPNYLYWDDDHQQIQLGDEKIVSSATNMVPVLSSYPTPL